MARKVRPRWGDDGVTEVPDFAFSPEQARGLATQLDITRPDDIDRLKQELAEIASFYLRWSAQDEDGPSRAERNAALKEVVAASRRLELVLTALDHASEAGIMDALAPYRSMIREFDEEGHVTDQRESQELGFRQIQALRDRLTHFNESVAPFLKRRLRQRGPEPRKTLPAIIGFLAEVYERETGQPVTHNPYEGVANYKGAPQSRAGRFMAAFFETVDPGLPATSIATELARFVKRSNRKSSPTA